MTADGELGLRELMGRLRHAQKSPASVPAYMRWVNRKVGGVLAVAGHRAGLTPTQVTVASAACSFTGIAVLGLVRPTPPVAAGVALSLALGFALDSADGQLARLRGGGTPAGEWLDHVVDAGKSSALHAAVAVSLYRFGDLSSPALLLLPLGFTVVGGTHYFGMMLRGMLQRNLGAPSGEQGSASVLRALLLLPVDHGVLCLTTALLPWTTAFTAVYGGLLAGTMLFAGYSLPKAYRVLARLGGPAAVVGPAPGSETAQPDRAWPAGAPGQPGVAPA